MQDVSYGIIPLIVVEGSYNTVVLLHRNGHFWGFPKGHLEPSETPLEAATRELFEETSLKVIKVLNPEPLQESYMFLKGHTQVYKQVLFYMCLVEGKIHIDGKEILDWRLCNLDSAQELLTYNDAKALIPHIKRFLNV